VSGKYELERRKNPKYTVPHRRPYTNGNENSINIFWINKQRWLGYVYKGFCLLRMYDTVQWSLCIVDRERRGLKCVGKSQDTVAQTADRSPKIYKCSLQKFCFLMSNQCKCPSARLFKHRADKCTFSTKSTRRVAQTSHDAAPPIPPSADDVAPQDASDSQTPSPVEQDGADASDLGTEASLSTAEIVQSTVGLASSTNELSAAQEVAASNYLLANGNEQCDCIAYRFKKHRKKMCSWKKHVAVGLATATVVAGTVVLATVVADETYKETAKEDKSTDPSHDNKEARHKKTTSQKKGVAVGLATASILAGTAALATAVVCDIQKDKRGNESVPSLVEGVNNVHLHSTAEPEVPPAAEGETDEPNETVNSNSESTQHEPEEEPDTEVEEEEESEEDFEARLRVYVCAERYAAMREAREAAAAILRAERLEEQRLQRERCELQQLSV